MFVRVRVLIVAVLMLVLVGGIVGAQVFSRDPVQPPIVLSGSDFGFEVTAHEGKTPVGNIVVKQDGKWIPVKLAPGRTRLSMR